MATTRIYATASRTSLRSMLSSSRRSLPAGTALQATISITRVSLTTTPVRRAYANNTGSTTQGTPQAATNIYNPTSSSPESQNINTQRGKESIPLESAGSPSRNPVSQPMHAGLKQDEPSVSAEETKRPPEEPDHVKRQYIEKEGQKPLDPADTGFGVSGIKSGSSSDGR